VAGGGGRDFTRRGWRTARMVRSRRRHPSGPVLVSGNLYLSHDGTKVLNYLQWETEAAFPGVPGRHGDPGKLMAVIGPYGPKRRTYDIAFSLRAADAAK